MNDLNYEPTFKIAPLNWKEDGSSALSYTLLGNSIVGEYKKLSDYRDIICNGHDPKHKFFWLHVFCGTDKQSTSGCCSSIEEGKNIVERDYQERLKKALVEL